MQKWPNLSFQVPATGAFSARKAEKYSHFPTTVKQGVLTLGSRQAAASCLHTAEPPARIHPSKHCHKCESQHEFKTGKKEPRLLSFYFKILEKGIFLPSNIHTKNKFKVTLTDIFFNALLSLLVI